jgi:hypothetical protein
MNSNNQIRKKMIRLYPKTDRQKLVDLRDEIHRRHAHVTVILEPFLLFSNGEDKYEGWYNELQKHHVRNYLVHPTDMIIQFENNGICREIFFELDGQIHDIKTEKTFQRNRRYELNDLEYIVINEADLKYKLGLAKSKSLIQEQINAEFFKKFSEKITPEKSLRRLLSGLAYRDH